MLTVYSARTGRIRRYTYDEEGRRSDAHLLVENPIGPGEAVFFSQEFNPDPVLISQEQLTIRTGLLPVDDRYAIVGANGDVLGAIFADPDTGDGYRDRTLVAHPSAESGWRQMRDGTFQRSLAVIDDDITRQDNAIQTSNNPTIVSAANAAKVVLDIERVARLASR